MGRAILDNLRQQLGLTVEEATEIEEEVLHPYQERLKNLQTYKETLIKQVEYEYPLSESVLEQLHRPQSHGEAFVGWAKIKSETEKHFRKIGLPTSRELNMVGISLQIFSSMV